MPANKPEQICELFQRYMAEGDVDSLLSIYGPEAVFLNQSGEIKKCRVEIREVLAPLAAARTMFQFKIKQVIQSGDIALMHAHWKMSAPQPCHSMLSRSHASRRMVAGAGSSVILLQSASRPLPESYSSAP